MAASRVLVAVDGPDGSGKTVLADHLADAIRQHQRPAVRISADDFHNVRAVRYGRGRQSAEGFWLDSYDYDTLIRDTLLPLSSGGDGRYRPAAHDLDTDQVLNPPRLLAPPNSIAVVDGLFLHRDELASLWDFSIFLDVPSDITARRMAVRDGTDPDPLHPSMRRYLEGHLLYLSACSPDARASIVIDNSNYDAPRVTRMSPG